MEQPKVYGSIMELPEDYFIIHLLKQRAWLVSSRKLVKYALLNTRQHYRLQYSKRPLGKVLHMLSPLTTIPLYFYYLILLAKDRKLFNIDTIISAWFDLALCRSVITFLQNIRNKREAYIAKTIERAGLMSLLHLELHELS